MNIAVSSLAFTGKSAEEIIAIAQKEKLVLEFSSGMPFRRDMEELFLKAPIKKLPHNYFPSPEIPFVLNLASSNFEIRNRSVLHCINGIRLASLAGAPFFSAHAGFCVDPNPAELGKKLVQSAVIDKQTNWIYFIDSLNKIMTQADHYAVDFCIENNVIAQMNLYENGFNPLFCCNDLEMIQIVKEVNHPRLGILLDTGHLKVSSQTLNFLPEPSLINILPYVKAIHHSDNDGIFDTNDPINNNYWFLKFMKKFENTFHVLEVRNQNISQIHLQINLLKSSI